MSKKKERPIYSVSDETITSQLGIKPRSMVAADLAADWAAELGVHLNTVVDEVVPDTTDEE